MKKTAFKTFIFSFSFSLFAMYTANELYFAGEKTPRKDIKISNKNISLFFKEETKVAPAKTAEVESFELAALEVKNHTPEENEAFSTEDIPLEYEQTAGYDVLNIPLADEEEIAEQADNTEETDVIVDNFEDFKKASPPILENELIITKEKDELPKAPSMNLAASVKKNINTTPTDTEAMPEVLIPIEKTYAKNKTSNEIRIVEKTEENYKIASASENAPLIPIKREEKIGNNKAADKEETWEPMAEKFDNPWVVAKGAKHPKNKMVLEDFAQSEEEVSNVLSSSNTVASEQGVEVSADTVKNILIPIPEKIMQEENLTPQLSSSDKDNDLEADVKTDIEKKANVEKTEKKADTEDKKSILQSLSSIFSTPSVDTGKQKKEQPKNDFFKQITEKIGATAKDGNSKILPTEMRLSFRPNRAEISGQTLKWMHAFANKLKEDPLAVLEIRIDGSSSFALQQKRLNLLQNILSSKGADLKRVNIVFTTREPNSFIIRAVKMENEEDIYEVARQKNSLGGLQRW